MRCIVRARLLLNLRSWLIRESLDIRRRVHRILANTGSIDLTGLRLSLVCPGRFVGVDGSGCIIVAVQRRLLRVSACGFGGSWLDAFWASIGLVMLGHDECRFSQSGGSQGCKKEQVAKTLGKARGRSFNLIARLGGFLHFYHERVINKAPLQI